MMSIFSPAPHIERLPEGQIDSTYKRLRKEVFAGTFYWLCYILFDPSKL